MPRSPGPVLSDPAGGHNVTCSKLQTPPAAQSSPPVWSLAKSTLIHNKCAHYTHGATAFVEYCKTRVHTNTVLAMCRFNPVPGARGVTFSFTETLRGWWAGCNTWELNWILRHPPKLSIPCPIMKQSSDRRSNNISSICPLSRPCVRDLAARPGRPVTASHTTSLRGLKLPRWEWKCLVNKTSSKQIWLIPTEVDDTAHILHIESSFYNHVQVRLHLNVKLFNGIMMKSFVVCMFCFLCIVNRKHALYWLGLGCSGYLY